LIDPSGTLIRSNSNRVLRSTPGTVRTFLEPDLRAVEKGLDVRLKNPVHFAPARHPVKGADRVVSASTGSKTIRAVQKVLLVDGLQHFTQGVLYDLVLERTEVRFLRRSVPYLADMPNGRVRPLSFGMCTRRIG
jgi:hypothetical protein